ncbi:MAG: T9SS type A sorting domain-containing protein [Bacteroidales bacterium]|nr:T9SS type A sorting domain-containing protein [Bacteroidales bacterium]MCF8456295.1 T9SS type A sorting domain-containing protein [Bacteroidales bacterium]
MIRNSIFVFGLILCFVLQASISSGQNNARQIVNINPDPNGEPWTVGGFYISPEEEAEMAREVKDISLMGRDFQLKNLPSEIDNSDQDLFRPIFNQLGGSCSQASGVAYTFTYEMNYLRGLSSALPENQYPSHFTYNFLNGGSGDNGSNYYTGWKIIQEIGCPSLDLYGGLYPIGNNGWMDGYDAYYSGMHNTVFDYWTIDVSTEAGLNTLKGWLVNHLDQNSTVGGLAVFSAGATDWYIHHLPIGTPHSTDFVITDFGPNIDHAMTIVGYNDSIRYDHNSDGQYTNNIDINNDGMVNIADWEIGGLIMANSWGSSWADGGKAFMMYRTLCDSNHVRDKQVHVLEPLAYYSPEITMKIKLAHPSRKALKFTAGASNDTSATSPEKTFVFTALNRKGGDFPMTGTNDTIELGLDISAFYAQMHDYEPTRIFISINEKDTGNLFDGSILNYSVLTYWDSIAEYPCLDSNVVITDDGLTRISVVISGNGFYPPSNLTSNLLNRDITLEWEAPPSYPVNWEISAYKIYRNDELLTTITDTSLFTFTDANLEDGTYDYTVSCVYSNASDFHESMQCELTSESIILDPIAGAGHCLYFDGQENYIIADTIDIAHKSFSMEFWAKRQPAGGDKMVIGHGQWGKGHKGMHFGFRDNNFYCGFYGDDISSDTAFLDTDWHHYAMTFDTATYLQSLYRDGELIKTRTSDTTYYGTGEVYIGVVSDIERYYKGYLDEVRIWDTVRTELEIRQGMFFPPASDAPGLLAYWQFDERMGNRTFDKSMTQNDGLLMNFDPLFVESDLWVYHTIAPDSTLELFAGYGQPGTTVSFYESLAPMNGSLSFDTQNLTLSYTPYGNWIGYDSLSYRVDDGIKTDSVKLYINPGNFPNLSQPEIAIEPESILAITIYPNPAKDKVVIILKENPESEIHIRLFDIEGRLIHSEIFSGNQKRIELNCDPFEEGSYFLELSDKNGQQVEKLILVE